jgi:hypothetical protein
MHFPADSIAEWALTLARGQTPMVAQGADYFNSRLG